MKRILFAIAALALASSANAQTSSKGLPYFPQTLPAGTVVGNSNSVPSATEAMTFSTLTSNLAKGAYPGTTTNDSAASGNVGEYTTGTGTAVSLTTTITSNVATVTLAAGDWDVWGTVIVTPAGTTTTSLVNGIIALAPTTLTPVTTDCFVETPYAGTAGVPISLPVGMCRVSVSVSTIIYLNINDTFAVSTETGGGRISARRVR